MPPSAALLRVEQLLAETSPGADHAPLILLNANCGDLLPLRQWPRERYLALAERLLARYPTARRVHRVRGRGARHRAAGARVASARCVSLAGRTTLEELLVLYSLAQVLVTNDSGPAHFATLTTVDVVTLFGPESPAVFAARSPRNHVFWAGLPCSPCINALNDRQSACRDNACMQAITVDAVFAKVCEIFEHRLARKAAAV
ncbi:MAG: glycosyltransferase family 9 protein [Planctomycetota bacterium]